MASNGTQPGQEGAPAFPEEDAPALGVDLEEVARYAKDRGNILKGTTTQRNAFADAVEGVLWSNTTTDSIDRYTGSAWVTILGPSVPVAGPGSQTDYGTSETQIVTASVPVISGQQYRVSAQVTGTQVTNAGVPTVRIRSGATPGSHGSGTELCRPLTGVSFAASTPAHGFAQWVYTAGSTGTVVFALTAQSSANAFRIPANGAQLVVSPLY